MKPLPSAPLSADDYEIWWLLVGTGRGPEWWRHAMFWRYLDADRRDATLMLRAVECRNKWQRKNLGWCRVVLVGTEGNDILVGGEHTERMWT